MFLIRFKERMKENEVPSDVANAICYQQAYPTMAFVPPQDAESHFKFFIEKFLGYELRRWQVAVHVENTIRRCPLNCHPQHETMQ